MANAVASSVSTSIQDLKFIPRWNTFDGNMILILFRINIGRKMFIFEEMFGNLINLKNVRGFSLPDWQKTIS